MTFQSVKTILSISDMQAKIAARIAQDEQKRAYGVSTYGWDVSCDCVDCGDNGIDPRTLSPCWCDAGRAAGRQHERMQAWKKLVPELQQGYELDTHPNRKLAANVIGWLSGMDMGNPHGPNLILSGEVGTGKTGMAVAAMRPMFMLGVHCIYGTLSMIMETLRPVGPYEDSNTLRMSIDRVCNTGLLVLDDIGKEKRSEWVGERLMLIADERHKRNKPTIITTNLKPDQLKDVVGEAIASRLTAGATILRAGGDDLRRQMLF